MASWVGVPGGVVGGVTNDGVGVGVGVCAECDVGNAGGVIAVVGGVVSIAGALA